MWYLAIYLVDIEVERYIFLRLIHEPLFPRREGERFACRGRFVLAQDPVTSRDTHDPQLLWIVFS